MFDSLKRMFEKNAKTISLKAVEDGRTIPMDEVNDQTFAQELLGPGIAIVPFNGTVVSPINGTIATVMDTKHAVCIQGEDGLELIVHAGLDTVELNGKYYQTYKEIGDQVKAGGALIDNMALLFVIGVGVGMADKHDGTGGLAALASWLMITNLLSTAVVTTIMPSIAKNADATLAFDKISNPFIGILAGVIGSMCYNKFKDTKLPDWLSFFSGKRCVAIIAGVVSIIVSVVLLFVWPVVFTALITVGQSGSVNYSV